MTWTSTRAAAGTSARERAHSDDAKHRTHDAETARPRFPKWVLPVAAGAAVVVVIGGTSTVLASRKEAPAQPPTARQQPSAASASQHQADGDAEATPVSSATPANGVVGRSFRLTGTWQEAAAAFHGHPGFTNHYPGTVRVTCDSSSCSVSRPHGEPRRFPKVSSGRYQVTYAVTNSVRYRVTETLTVTEKVGRLVFKHPGVVVSDSVFIAPLSATLTGPIHFTD